MTIKEEDSLKNQTTDTTLNKKDIFYPKSLDTIPAKKDTFLWEHSIDTLKTEKIIFIGDSMRSKEQTITVTHKSKSIKEKSIYESPLCIGICSSAASVAISLLFGWLLYYQKHQADRKKTKEETNKIQKEVDALKLSLQPTAISMVSEIHGRTLEFRLDFYSYFLNFTSKINPPFSYVIKGAYLAQLKLHYNTVFSALSLDTINEFRQQIAKNGNYFPEEITSRLSTLEQIISHVSRELQLTPDILRSGKSQVLENIVENLEKFHNKTQEVISLMRNNIFMDESYLHQFIKFQKEQLKSIADEKK